MLALADLVEHTLRYGGKDLSRATCTDALGAARQAIQILSARWDWNWFRTTITIPISSPYSTGTIQYVASTRTATLTGGTWPAWAIYGAIKINDISYLVTTRTSDTVIILDAMSAPADNISTDTTFEIRRVGYQLPEHFDSVRSAVTDFAGLELEYRDQTEAVQIWQEFYGSQCYTVANDRNATGRMVIQFSPNVDATNSVQVLYKRRMPVMRYDNFSDPDSSRVAVAGTAVTGSETAFKSNMVGMLFRCAENDAGEYPTGEFGNNMYFHESIISGYSSATALTLQTAISDAVTRSKYIVSSLIDVSPGPMVEYLFREAEKQFRAKTRMVPYNPEELDNYEVAFIQARENDKRYTGPRVVDYANAGRFVLTNTNTPMLE